MALLLNPATGHLLPQFHVFFDDELSTVQFRREVTITHNLMDLVKCISQIFAPDNIDLKETWFDPDLEEDPRKS